MKTRTLLFVHASLFATLVAGTAGIAGASNNYPGFECVALSGAVHPNSSGHAENTSTAAATVMCPVFVDAGTSGQAASGTPVAFVTDQNLNADVCCSARVKNTGQSVVSGGSVCSSGTNAAAQSLTLTNPATPGGNFTFTHRWLQCDVPAVFSGVPSEIRTYRY
jgi:hypothetical protein